MKHLSTVIIAMAVVAGVACAQPCTPIVTSCTDPALAAGILITQSMDNSQVSTINSVMCGGGNPFIHADTSYWRSYTLANEGVTTNIDVLGIRFGVETATAGSGGQQPVQIRLYTDPAPAGTTINLANLTLIHTETVSVLDATTPTILEAVMSVPPTVAQNQTLVVELFAPDGGASGHSIFLGTNNLGECAPTFFSAPPCATPAPITPATIGFPTAYVLLDVCYQPSVLAVTYPGSGEDLQLLSDVNGAGLNGGIGNDIKTTIANDVLTIFVNSPGGSLNFAPLFVVFDIWQTGVPNAPLVPGAVYVGGSFGVLVGPAPLPVFQQLVPPGGWYAAFSVPPGLSGQSVLFQAAAFNPAATLLPNVSVSDGHEIQNQ